MKKSLFALVGALALLTACQKEAEFTDPGGGNPPGGGGTTTPKNQLIRQVQVDGTDSVVLDYVYDGAGRVVKIKVDDAGEEGEFRLYRNSTGLLTRMVIAAEGLFQPGVVDSFATSFFANASGQYTHARTDVNIGGASISDSSVISYSGANISSVLSYNKVNLPGMPYRVFQKADYTYNGGNLASVKYYDVAQGTTNFVLATTFNFTYDSKPNALKLGAEGVLLGFVSAIGDNNILTEEEIHAGPPPSTTTYTSTYTYTSFNKPANGTLVENPGNVTSTLRYYYK